MLQILSPLARREDIDPLIEVSADEFYAGFRDSNFQNANKRENPKASFLDRKEFEEAVRHIKSKGKKFCLALNERIYEENIDQVKLYIQGIDTVPFDAYIVQDYAILKLLSEIGTKKEVHLSSLTQVWNQEAIRFYLDMFPIITRIIFSREITIDEMKEICKQFPDTEFEAFVLNDWCYNIDGICASLHHEICEKGLLYVCHREYLYKHCRKCSIMNKNLQTVLQNRPACFVCSMYYLNTIKNLSSVKIVGRDKPLKDLINSVKFVNTVRKLLEKNMPYGNFIRYVQEVYLRIYLRPCDSEKCQFALE